MDVSAKHGANDDRQTTYEPSRAFLEDIDSEEGTSASNEASENYAEEEEYGPDERDLTAIEQQYRTTPDFVKKRIFVLGTGSLGKLVAHSLRTLPDPPPVTLLFHRMKVLEAWRAGPGQITVNRNGTDIKASGFDDELEIVLPRAHEVPIKPEYEELFNKDVPNHEVAQFLKEQGEDIIEGRPPRRKEQYKAVAARDTRIHNLVVTLKAHATVGALLRIKYRIQPTTTICLLQNGMGMIEELNEKVFTDPERRPKYVQGIVTHGANVPPQVAEEDPFYVVHAGQGTIALGLVSQEPWLGIDGTRYLLRTLTRSPVLAAVTHTPTELLQLQLEKLAVNCCINTLTVILDARNGAIRNNFQLGRTMRLMLAEISLVIRSLPELKGLANIDTRFSAGRLQSLVYSVAKRTGNNISSTLADVRAGRQTEIPYINGYIVRRGEELGIKCVVNYSMMNLVLGKEQMIKREVQTEMRTDVGDLHAGLD